MSGFKSFSVSSVFPSNWIQLWTVQDGGITGSFTVMSVVTDSSGNIYATGHASAGLDGNTSKQGFFISKYNANKVLQWTVVDGATLTYGSSIAVDSSNNVYVAGYTGAGLDGNTLHGNTDGFLTKYDSSGNRLWTQEYGAASGGGGGNLITYGLGVAVDPTSSYVYVTGYTATPLSGQSMHGNQDLYISQFKTTSGLSTWTVQDGASGGNTSGHGIAVDPSGYIYVVGVTNAAIDGLQSYGLNDYFLTKYDSSHTLQWTIEDGASETANTLGSIATASGAVGSVSGLLANASMSDTTAQNSNTVESRILPTLPTIIPDASASTYGNGIAIDSSGNIFITGMISAPITTSAVYLDGQSVNQTSSFFISGYDSSGTIHWTTVDGPAADGASIDAQAIAVDAVGGVYVTGQTTSSIDGQPHLGYQDLFITKYNSNGNYQWTVDDGAGAGSSVSCYAITVDSSGYVYVAGGVSSGSLDGQSQHGYYDLFLSKY